MRANYTRNAFLTPRILRSSCQVLTVFGCFRTGADHAFGRADVSRLADQVVADPFYE